MRDGFRCAACGLDNHLTLQHRSNRQMGGDKTARKGLRGVKDRFSNLLTMCMTCNTRLESDRDFMQKGIDNGWKLKQYMEPRNVPVCIAWLGEYRLLEDDMTFIVVESLETNNELEGFAF